MGMKDHVHPRRQRGLVRRTEEGRLHDVESLAVARMGPLFQPGGGDGLRDARATLQAGTPGFSVSSAR